MDERLEDQDPEAFAEPANDDDDHVDDVNVESAASAARAGRLAEVEESRLCPCCGEELAPGLFSRVRKVEMPVPLQLLSQSDQAAAIEGHAGGVLVVNGRSFLPVHVPLPLFWLESPVAARLWVETPVHVGEDYIRFQEGKFDRFQASGSLACDLPGFPGAFGSPVEIEAKRGDDLPRLTWCADQRILLLGREEGFAHDDLVRLYRRLWGGSGETAPADPDLRSATLKTLESHYGHFYPKPIEPIGPYAGIAPPEVLIRPPLDTDGIARFATLGIAEAMPGPRKVELVTAARNGGEAFEKSFSEFCFWSRREVNPPLEAGMVIPETNGSIPTYKNLAAWILVDNFDILEGALCPPPVELGAATLSYLAAIPITVDELAFAAQFGPGELLKRLEASEIDITDLHRESCVPLGG